MSDENAPTPAAESAVDPVAAARQIMAAKETGAGDAVASLRRQVRVLWIVTSVTLVLVLVLAAFTLLPRLFGVRMGGFQGRPDGFIPGQGRQSAPDQGTNQ